MIIIVDDLDLSFAVQTDNQASIEEFERQRTARNLAVPTDDARVQKLIQEEGEPRTLFGEGVSFMQPLRSLNVTYLSFIFSPRTAESD